MKTETRFVTGGGELRIAGASDEFMVMGRAVKYGALSAPGVPMPGARERIQRGAFRAALAKGEEDVKALFNHDQNVPLGRVANGTLKLTDDDDGLRFAVRLDPAVQAHRDLHANVKSGLINECSFAFAVEPDGDDWEEDPEERGCSIRTVKKARLFDVSLVTAPAYPGSTEATARALQYRFARSGVTMPRGRSLESRLEEERTKEFRTQVNLRIAKMNAELGIELWVPDGYDERGIPTGVHPATMAEHDAWLRKQADRIGEELRAALPRDAYGRVFGDPDFDKGNPDEWMGDLF